MKKNLCRYVTLLALVCCCLIAHPSVGYSDSPLAVNEILKKTGAIYLRTQAFTANFHQSVNSAAASNMTTEASGKLFYEKPRQMRWEYEKPEIQVFVANQQLAWLYAPVEKQITLSDPKRIFSHPLAQAFFDGVDAFKKHYEVTLDHKRSNKEEAVLKLIPKNEDPEIKTLFLSIDLQSYRIAMIEVHNALGNINRITLSSQRAMASLDPKLFQLEVPPAIDVLDAEGRPLTPADLVTLKQRLSQDSAK
jgi:outer membrane lipoprotein carrier protein